MSDVGEPTEQTERERIRRGAEVYEQVYGGVLPAVPPGVLEFTDVMYAHLFAGQWSRPGLRYRDRRLLTLAVIAAVGDADTWAIHLEAALRNEELSEDEAREIVIHLAPYVGYPRVSPMAARTEVVIAKLAAEQG